MSKTAAPRSATERVVQALAAQGVEVEVRTFPEGTRTAVDAANAIGTRVEQIVKSLVFEVDGQAVVVLASGGNQVDTAKLGALAGGRATRADAHLVRSATGFAIGGVAPVGFPQPLHVYVDEDLLLLDEVWAAAGTPHAVFRIDPATLVRVSGGSVADVKREVGA